MMDAGKIVPGQVQLPRWTGTSHASQVQVTSPHEQFIRDGNQRTPAVVPPNFAPDVAATGGTREAGVRWGYLASAGLAAVMIGGVLGGCTANNVPPPEPGQTVIVQDTPVSSQERHAIANLDLLQQVGQRNGGGLERDVFLGIHGHATVAQAYQELHQGNSVFWVEQKDATPHEIHNYQELQELSRQVQIQESKRQIDQGIQDIKQGFQNALDDLKNIGK